MWWLWVCENADIWSLWVNWHFFAPFSWFLSPAWADCRKSAILLLAGQSPTPSVCGRGGGQDWAEAEPGAGEGDENSSRVGRGKDGAIFGLLDPSVRFYFCLFAPPFFHHIHNPKSPLLYLTVFLYFLLMLSILSWQLLYILFQWTHSSWYVHPGVIRRLYAPSSCTSPHTLALWRPNLPVPTQHPHSGLLSPSLAAKGRGWYWVTNR